MSESKHVASNTAPDKAHFDLHTKGCGYLGRVRWVKPRGGGRRDGRRRPRRKARFPTAFARRGPPLQARRAGAMIAALHRARRRVVMKETS